MDEKVAQRIRRKRRIRVKVQGTPERPRLAVFRSARHIYAQVIDDVAGQTLCCVGTLTPELREAVKGLKKRDAAKKVGEALAGICKGKGITKVVFDRGGYAYDKNNRVGMLADGARKGGLGF